MRSARPPGLAVASAQAAAGHDDQGDFVRGPGRWHTLHAEADEKVTMWTRGTCPLWPRARPGPPRGPIAAMEDRNRCLRFTCAEPPSPEVPCLGPPPTSHAGQRVPTRAVEPVVARRWCGVPASSHHFPLPWRCLRERSRHVVAPRDRGVPVFAQRCVQPCCVQPCLGRCERASPRNRSARQEPGTSRDRATTTDSWSREV